MILSKFSDLRLAVVDFDRQFKNLASLIRMLVSAKSAQQDLKRAKEFLEVATKVAGGIQVEGELKVPRIQNDEDGLVVGSVINSAIMAYCRAADGRESNGRTPIPLANDFTSEEKAAHGRILKVRDKALAHFDKTGGFIDGPWAVDRLVLNHGHPDVFLPPQHQWQRVNYRENIVKDIFLVTDAGLRGAAAVCDKFEQELNAEIALHLAKKEFWKILDRHQVPEAELVRANQTTLYPAKPRE